jgi:hypothetical protein
MNKLTKAHHICLLLAAHGTLTRDQLTHGAWVLEGAKIPYKVTSNHCYFSPTGRGNGGEMSLVHRGLITQVGKRGRKFLYGLTPAGQALLNTYVPMV